MTSGTTNDNTRRLLHLTLTPGLGPILARRVLQHLGSRPPDTATASELANIRGIGSNKAARLADALRQGQKAVDTETRHAETIGARFVTIHDHDYPDLLRELPDAPLLLTVRGELRPPGADHAWPIAIVGSRRCTAYGMRQAERFAASLADAGLTIVSGGARGIDTAAHRAALDADGHTIAVLGCGLANCYPPENRRLFEEVITRGGALISELPLSTEPAPENFPARNRIISGLCLGVLVVEAPERSGALITAQIAVEDHGRDVFAIPGPLDAPASRGTNTLIRNGAAALVMQPLDVVQDLEHAAHHQHRGTHHARFSPTSPGHPDAPTTPPIPPPDLTPIQRRILERLQHPTTIHELLDTMPEPPETLLPQLTQLELARLVSRSGSHLQASVTIDFSMP